MTFLAIEQQSTTKFNDFCIQYSTLEQNCPSIRKKQLELFYQKSRQKTIFLF